LEGGPIGAPLAQEVLALQERCRIWPGVLMYAQNRR
jgi:hypothetical protein